MPAQGIFGVLPALENPETTREKPDVHLAIRPCRQYNPALTCAVPEETEWQDCAMN
jgi:hypothetical protein